MNFEHMPELRWRQGYYAVLGAMAAFGLGLVLLFRRLGWIGTARGARPSRRG